MSEHSYTILVIDDEMITRATLPAALSDLFKRFTGQTKIAIRPKKIRRRHCRKINPECTHS